MLSAEGKNRDEKFGASMDSKISSTSRASNIRANYREKNDFERKFFFPSKMSPLSSCSLEIKKTSVPAKDFDTRALFPVFLSKQRTPLLWPHD